MLITAYRITKRRYASSIWSGAGARDHVGRWNSRGVAVVYTAQSRSLAALEQLVHLVKPRILTGYVVAAITFDDSLMQRVDPGGLPRGWDAPVAPAALRNYGDAWVAAGRYPVLGVPSAVIPGEWNFLLNPQHAQFPTMPKSKPERSVYDRRLE